jgi:hypothetical protein
MSAHAPTDELLVARAIEEAIESVTTRQVRQSLIATALARAGLTSIPPPGPEVIAFVEGELIQALAARVGHETALEVLEQVRPILRRVLPPRVSRRPTPVVPLPLPASRPTLRAPQAADPDELDESGVFRSSKSPGTCPAPSGPLATIFLASRDADAAIALALGAQQHAAVRVVEGLLDLLDAIDEESDGTVRVLVTDGLYPTVQIASLVAVAPDLIGRVTVVLWRPRRGDRPALATAAESTAGWIEAGARPPAELAALCVAAIDPIGSRLRAR